MKLKDYKKLLSFSYKPDKIELLCIKSYSDKVTAGKFYTVYSLNKYKIGGMVRSCATIKYDTGKMGSFDMPRESPWFNTESLYLNET